MPETAIKILKDRLVGISHLNSTLNLLDWDQKVNMPKKGAGARAESFAYLSTLIHGQVRGLDEGGELSRLKKLLDEGKLIGDNAVLVAETWRTFERAMCLPDNFVRELAKLTSIALNVWAEAREKNDFLLFLPYLEKIVKMKREEATLVGFKNSPYDAPLDAHEPGMHSVQASAVLLGLKEFLIPFLKRLAGAPVKIDQKVLRGRFRLRDQMAFNRTVLQAIGFDLESGRLDASTPPFSIGFHP